MTIHDLSLHKLSQLAVQVSASTLVVCGAGEWIVWDWLKAVPCETNSTIEWKGLSKCVTTIGATLWNGLDYGTRGAFVGFVLSALLTKVSEPRKR